MCNFNAMCCGCNRRHWNCCRWRHGCCYPQVRVTGLAKRNEGQQSIKENVDTVLMESTQTKVIPVIVQIVQDKIVADSFKLSEPSWIEQNSKVEQVDYAPPARSPSLTEVKLRQQNDASTSGSYENSQTKTQADFLCTKCCQGENQETVRIRSLEKTDIKKDKSDALDKKQTIIVKTTINENLTNRKPIQGLRRCTDNKDQVKCRKRFRCQSQSSCDSVKPNVVTKSTADSNPCSIRQNRLRSSLKRKDPIQDLRTNNDGKDQPTTNQQGKCGKILESKFTQSNSLSNFKANVVTKATAASQTSSSRLYRVSSLKTRDPVSNVTKMHHNIDQRTTIQQDTSGKSIESSFEIPCARDSCKVNVAIMATTDSNAFSSRPNNLRSSEPKRRIHPREKVHLPSSIYRITRSKVETLPKLNRPFRPINLPNQNNVYNGEKGIKTVKKVDQVEKPKSKIKPKRTVKKKNVGALRVANSKQEPQEAAEESTDIWFEYSVPFRVSIPSSICCPEPWNLLQATLCRCEALNGNNNIMKALTGSKNDMNMTKEPSSGLPPGKMYISVRPISFDPNLLFPTQSLIPLSASVPMDYGGNNSMRSVNIGTNGPPSNNYQLIRPDFPKHVPPSMTSKNILAQQKVNSQRRQNCCRSQESSYNAIGKIKANRPALKNVLEVIRRYVCKQRGNKQKLQSRPAAVSRMSCGYTGAISNNRNSDGNCLNLSPQVHNIGSDLSGSTGDHVPQQTMSGLMKCCCCEQKKIEQEFQSSTHPVCSDLFSTIPNSIEYKTPYQSADSGFCNAVPERDHRVESDSTKTCIKCTNCLNKQYSNQKRSPGASISETPSSKVASQVSQITKDSQSWKNQIAPVSKRAIRNSVILEKSANSTQIKRETARESTSVLPSSRSRSLNSAPPVKLPRSSRTPKSRAKNYCSPTLESTSQASDSLYLSKNGVVECRRETMCENLKKSIENEKSDTNSLGTDDYTLSKKLSLILLKTDAGRSLPKINTQFLKSTSILSEKFNCVKKVKSLFQPIGRYLTAKNYKFLQAKRNDPTNNIVDKSNKLKDLSDSRFIELPRRKCTAKCNTQILSDYGNTSKSNRSVPNLNENDLELLSDLKSPTALQIPVVYKLETPRNILDTQSTNTKLKLKKSLGASCPNSCTLISQSLRHANKRQNLNQDFSEESDSDDYNNRNEVPLSRQKPLLHGIESSVSELFHKKNPKICLLKRENSSSPATLEEYSVTAFSCSFSKHTLRKGGSEFSTLSLENLRPINKQNVDDVLAKVKDYCENRSSFMDRSEKPAVLVPFRKDCKHCVRMTVCEPDEWKEFKMPMAKTHSDKRATELCSSQSQSFDEARLQYKYKIKWRDGCTERGAHVGATPNLQANHRAPSKVCKTKQTARDDPESHLGKNSTSHSEPINNRQASPAKGVMKLNHFKLQENVARKNGNYSNPKKNVAGNHINRSKYFNSNSYSTDGDLQRGTQNDIKSNRISLLEIPNSDVSVENSFKSCKDSLVNNETSNFESPQNNKPNNNRQTTVPSTHSKFQDNTDEGDVEVLLNPKNLRSSSRDNKNSQSSYRGQQNKSIKKNTEDKVKQTLEKMPEKKMNSLESSRCAQLERQNQELLRELKQFHQLMQKGAVDKGQGNSQSQMQQTWQQSMSDDQQSIEWQHDQSLQDCQYCGKRFEVRGKLQESQPEQLDKEWQENGYQQQPVKKKNQFSESSNHSQVNQNACCYCVSEGPNGIPNHVYEQTLIKYGIKAMPCNCQKRQKYYR